MTQPMNLNEECLLEFLSGPELQNPEMSAIQIDSLSSELKRIHRRDRYVSFPQAILIRRSK
jgi:hypothetical protein